MSIYCRNHISKLAIDLFRGSVLCAFGAFYLRLEGNLGLYASQVPRYMLISGVPLLAFPLSGFLWWNWPPLKVFMGDVGSGFLGVIFFVYAIEGERTGSAPDLVWAVLLALFVIDATLTLLHRMKRKEKLFQTHRSHVYQLAVQKGHSHQVVSLAVLVLDIAFFVFLVVIERAMMNPGYRLLQCFCPDPTLGYAGQTLEARSRRQNDPKGR